MKERPLAQPSFVDQLVSDKGGPRTAALLARLDNAVPWEALAGHVRELPEYKKYILNPKAPGTRPISPVVMLKCVMLQKWFNLSDPQLEEQLQDRLSFRRFVGLSLSDMTPDETTFVIFRRRLREAKLDRVIFDEILLHIDAQGLLVKEGTLVDASIIEQARGRKTGKKDEAGEAISTRDPEASFTAKHGRSYHGYKLHTAVDRSGIVTDFVAGTASEHDSQRIDELIEFEPVAVFADSAYSSAERRAELEEKGVLPAIIYKRVRGQAELEPWQKKWNRTVSKMRALVEHPFAWIAKTGFTGCRYRGLRRNAFDFAMILTAINIKRSLFLAA